MQDLHVPVLLQEVLSYLDLKNGGIYVDGNLGLGGHSEAILENTGPDGRVIGFDWDKEALEMARQRLAPYGRRVTYVQRNFARLAATLDEMAINEVDGVLLDLGLSSLQLDESGRGFSFKGNEPLDMRMDQELSDKASDLVNKASRDELADIFYYYGEERQARRIADFLVEERQKKMILTTEQLVAVIKRAVPSRFYPKKIHVATKVFQGLRIAVNSELDNLAAVLEDAPALLKENGRICVISFHSLEDRMVKQAFQRNKDLQVVTKKPVMAGESESKENPRSRSAKLRVAEKRRVI